MKKDLLKLLDLSSQDILTILDTADQLKAMKKAGIQHPFLAGKTLAMIFEKNSTRTRVSFETGMYQLGGNAIYLSDKDSQIGRNEPVEDTARVLSRFCDGIMIRTFAQEEVETLAKYASIPVINGLTDFCHPCQVLADLMTIREHKGKLAGRHDGVHRLPRCLPPGPCRSGLCPAVSRHAPVHPGHPGRRQGRRRPVHRRVGLHGTGGRVQPA